MAGLNGVDAVPASQATSQGGSPGGYLKSLQDRHPDLQLMAGAASPGSMPAHGAGTNNVLIDPRYLGKMESDPKTAKEGEEMLNGIPAAQNWLRSQVAAMGATLVESGMVIDKNGGMSSWGVARTTAGSDEDQSIAGMLSHKEKDKRSAKTPQGAVEQLQAELERARLAKAEEASATHSALNVRV